MTKRFTAAFAVVALATGWAPAAEPTAPKDYRTKPERMRTTQAAIWHQPR